MVILWTVLITTGCIGYLIGMYVVSSLLIPQDWFFIIRWLCCLLWPLYYVWVLVIMRGGNH